MSIDSIISEKFLSVMESGSNLPDIRKRLEKLKSDEQKSEFIIPVLGVQGAGKSSFLNALLFHDIVLPVEVTETTCIPTEIYYADVPQPEASVFLENGTEQKIPCTEDGLKQFVHQEFNPGNCKKVVRVVIRLKHDLLKTGLVIVDLPGVGSGTEDNQKRTMDYLNKSSGGIFILAESLKTPDALFISTALPILGNVFFIQNRWSGETSADTQTAAEYNHGILDEKAKELHIPISQIPEFNIVAVQSALNSVIQDDPDAYATSGMLHFQNILIDFANSWKADMKVLHISQVQGLIRNQINQIAARTAVLKNDPIPEQEKLQQRQQNAEKEFAEKEALIQQVNDFLQAEQSNFHTKFNNLLSVAQGELRTAVRNLIDNGLTSGEQLNDAFNDHVMNQNNTIYQSVFADTMTVTSALKERLAGFESGEEFGKLNFSGTSPFSEKTQVHSVYSTVGGSAGAVAGTIIGGAVGGPLGAFVGGLLGSFVGSLVGKGGKYIHLKIQKNEAMQELFKAVQSIGGEIRKKYNDSIDAYFSGLIRLISQWYSARKEIIQKEIQDLLDAVKCSASEKEKSLQELAEQENFLKDSLQKLQEEK